MIRILRGMPVGVLGLEAVDDVQKQVDDNVVVPAVDAAIAEHGKVRPSMCSVPSSTMMRETQSGIPEVGARHPPRSSGSRS